MAACSARTRRLEFRDPPEFPPPPSLKSHRQLPPRNDAQDSSYNRHPRALERDCTTQIVQSLPNHRAFLCLLAKPVPRRRYCQTIGVMLRDLSRYATYQDLMHRTNNCASLLALHWLTRPNYGKPWLEIDLPDRPEPPHT